MKIFLGEGKKLQCGLKICGKFSCFLPHVMLEIETNIVEQLNHLVNIRMQVRLC